MRGAGRSYRGGKSNTQWGHVVIGFGSREGSSAASAFFRGFCDPSIGRATNTRADFAVLVGKHTRKALGDVRAAVVTLGHWTVVTPAEAGTTTYPVNR